MPPSPRVPKKVLWALATVSFLGFADAAFLAAKFFAGEAPDCVLLGGCDVVTMSQYATVGGVPVALAGALFYLTVFVFTLLHLDRKSLFPLKIIFNLSVFGFLFTLYLIYLQFFVLHAICIYCMFSALTTTVLFVLALIYLRPHVQTVGS